MNSNFPERNRGIIGVSFVLTTVVLAMSTAPSAMTTQDSASRLVFSTYLGGGKVGSILQKGFGSNYGTGIAVDKDGYIYVTGRTRAADFPTVHAVQGTYGGGDNDAFIAKLRPDGQAYVYCTYLGGSDVDFGERIAVDDSGCAYVAGATYSKDFPTTPNGYQRKFGGGDRDGFICKLSADGKLIYSTLLGGKETDRCTSIAVDREGNAYVTGSTNSDDFPTTHLLRAKPVGEDWDAFVAKLDPSGAKLIYATRFGGTSGSAVAAGGIGNEGGTGIAVDAEGTAYVTGFTDAHDFSTVKALQTGCIGGTDAFIARLDATGTSFLFSTYLGGFGDDVTSDIALDSKGNVYVTGRTTSVDFPTRNALQPKNNGALLWTDAKGGILSEFPSETRTKAVRLSNAFVTRLNAGGTEIGYSTYLGGSSSDSGSAVAVDSAGCAYIAGRTQSKDFPTLGQLEIDNHGGFGADAFVVKLDASGTSRLFATYLGAKTEDAAQGIAVDGSGNAYVIGWTGYGGSTRDDHYADFPVFRAVQPKRGGPTYNVFISKIGIVPTGAKLP